MKKKCGKNYFKGPKMAAKDDATILFAATIITAPTVNARWAQGNPRRVGNLEGRVQGSNGGQGELVFEQSGTEVDNSYHIWRVPSK